MPPVGGAGESPSLLPRTDAKKPFSTWFSSMELSTPHSTEKSVLQQRVKNYNLIQTSSSPHNILKGANISIQSKEKVQPTYDHTMS